jgi:hypothetical protein
MYPYISSIYKEDMWRLCQVMAFLLCTHGLLLFMVANWGNNFADESHFPNCPFHR